MDIFSVLKNLGVIGVGGSPTNSLVKKPDSLPYQNTNLNDFIEAGGIEGPDAWYQHNISGKKAVTLDSQIRTYAEMSEWDLVAAILSEVVEEASQTDTTNPNALWYECNDKNLESELNKMLEDVHAEDIIASQVYHIAAFGNSFDKIEYSLGDGVTGLTYVHPIDVRRYWLKKNRKCIGFSWTGKMPDKEAAFIGNDGREIPRITMSSSSSDTSRLFYPWDFMHLRRMHRTRATEHGEPIFNDAQGIYRKLRLALDQMTVHRSQIQPDRYAISIDCTGQSTIEQYKSIQRMKQSLRSRQAYNDPRSGFAGDSSGIENPSGFSSFYNPWALDTIMFIPKVEGKDHNITKLQGTQNIPDVFDIEMLLDLFYDIVGVPRNWFSNKEGGENPPSGKALLAQDMKFLRKIKSIRRPIIQGYTWLGKFHAYLRNKPESSSGDIKAVMPQIGGLEDQLRLEMLRTNAELLDLLADIMDKYNLPREAWVEVVFDKYLKLPRDIVDVFITTLPSEIEAEESYSKPTPPTSLLLREVSKALSSQVGKVIVDSLKDSVRNYVELDDSRFSRVTFGGLDVSRAVKGDIIAMGDKDFVVGESGIGEEPDSSGLKTMIICEATESDDKPVSDKVDRPSYYRYMEG